MMEEIQNIGQPEDMPEVVAEEIVSEIVSEAEATEEQQEQKPADAPADAPKDEPEEKGHRGFGDVWKALVEFLIKRKRTVLYVALALVAVLVVMFIIYRNQVGKNRYETLVQTITEMKRISEFCTANYIGEVMIQDEEKQFLNHKSIVLIVRGKVRMGYDLSKMETAVVNDSTINLTLPQARVLDIITNPSDIRTFNEKGNWSHERVTITKNAARAKLLELVMEENLLATAEDNGKRQLAAIFSSFGFKHVNIDFVADSTDAENAAMVGDSVSENATTLYSN